MYTINRPPPLSAWEKVGLFFRLAFIAPLQAILNVSRCLCIAAIRGLPLRFYAQCGIARVIHGSFSARQIQYFSPSTSSRYKTWMATRLAHARTTNDKFLLKRLRYDVEGLPDGESSILWIGNRRRATKFVYFLHGGAYVVSLNGGHLEWCLRAYVQAAAAAKDGEDVAVAVLEYTLCPAGQYPVQLSQAAAGLAHLLRSGISPRNLVIGGDSAGGNLTAQLLGHILHPHPDVKAIGLDGPLAGAFAVSPWVSGHTDTRSFVENEYIDMLSPYIVRNSCNYLLEGVEQYAAERSKGHGWAMAVDVDGGWLEGLETVTREVYVTVGGQEVLRDQGITFAETIRTRNPRVSVRLEIMENEAHDWIMLEGMAHWDGDATKRMRAWVSDVFWNQ
ncbi:Alpha/Beta hydrolase protein [Apodospora peruviana]|uniref:Alpha/Beta hydrolase protein n=1 Tax=Apodospora peruviana TaxID=516989 RepID=A0AAE0IB55_9PEZI|nr:Alpha/Beta hydrolase protein [Apodospora peruviana]